MAKKWAEVESSSQYQALPPEAREKARQQYFQQVIVPQLPADKVEVARKQFDSQTMKAAAKPPEKSWLRTQAEEFGTAAKNVGEGVARVATGVTGSVVGDVAGLGALAGAAIGDAWTGEVGGSGIDPAAIRDKVANALTYQPSDPNSVTNKILNAPGNVIAGAGEGLAKVTGTEDIPLLGDVVRAVPMAAASLMGVRQPAAPKGAPAAAPGPAAQARARSTVNPPEAGAPVDAVPPTAVASRPQLPAPQTGLPAAPVQPGMPAGPAAAMPPPGAQPRLGGAPGGPAPEMKSANMPPPGPAPKAPPASQREGGRKLKDATPEELHQDAVKTLLENNVQLTRGQRGVDMRSRQLQSMGRAADTLIGSSKQKLQQMQDFTAAVFEKVGIKARNATEDAMLELKRSTEQKYMEANKDVSVPIDGQLIADLQELSGRAARTTSKTENVFDAQIDHLRRSAVPDASNPNAPHTLSGEAANNIRIELGLLEGSSNPAVRKLAGDLKDALDAAVERGAPPDKVATLKEARGQFHFMKQIEDAIVKGKNGVFISPNKLLSVIGRKRNKNEAVYGLGDQRLVKLAEAGKRILPDDVGDSGSATRHGDIFKLGAMIHDPVTSLKLGAAVLGGRFLNEGNARKGTRAWNAEQVEKKARGSSPTITGLRVAAAADSRETEEEKKRRRQAEALRSN